MTPKKRNSIKNIRAAIEWAPAYERLDLHGLSLIPGYVMEMGVYKGQSLRKIAEQLPWISIFGFDSMKGLPEDWGTHKAGEYAAPDIELRENVVLYVGMFADVLPRWLAGHPGPISLIHIDCDLYSSTKTVLDCLAPRMQYGTILIFDEFMGYDGWEKHEAKAFSEFLTQYHFGFICLRRNGVFATFQLIPEYINAETNKPCEWHSPVMMHLRDHGWGMQLFKGPG